MDTFIIAVFALLTAANVYFYIRLRTNKQAPRTLSVLSAYLPFLIYMICVLVFHLPIPWYVLLIGMAAQFTQTFFGYFRNAFERSMKFDRYMHALGCFAYALLIYFTLYALIGGEISRIYAALFTGALGMSFGLLIEIFEFVSDHWSKSPIKHQKGLKDTDVDLVCDLIGSVCAGVFTYLVLL